MRTYAQPKLTSVKIKVLPPERSVRTGCTVRPKGSSFLVAFGWGGLLFSRGYSCGHHS